MYYHLVNLQEQILLVMLALLLLVCTMIDLLVCKTLVVIINTENIR